MNAIEIYSDRLQLSMRSSSIQLSDRDRNLDVGNGERGMGNGKRGMENGEWALVKG